MFNRSQFIKLSLLITFLLNMSSAHADFFGFGNSKNAATSALKTAKAADIPTPAAIKISGAILTDKNGMTLYTFDNDEAGSRQSVCNGNCAVSWPSLTAADAAKDIGDFSVVERNDGSKQWAFRGKPLYLWGEDSKAGDVTGDGVGGVWHKAAR